MNEPLRKHLADNYKLYQITKGHLDSAEFVVEGNLFIGIEKNAEFNCSNCDEVRNSNPLVHWRLSKSGKQWIGRCSCRKKFKIPIIKRKK